MLEAGPAEGGQNHFHFRVSFLAPAPEAIAASASDALASSDSSGGPHGYPHCLLPFSVASSFLLAGPRPIRRFPHPAIHPRRAPQTPPGAASHLGHRSAFPDSSSPNPPPDGHRRTPESAPRTGPPANRQSEKRTQPFPRRKEARRRLPRPGSGLGETQGDRRRARWDREPPRIHKRQFARCRSEGGGPDERPAQRTVKTGRAPGTTRPPRQTPRLRAPGPNSSLAPLHAHRCRARAERPLLISAGARQSWLGVTSYGDLRTRFVVILFRGLFPYHKSYGDEDDTGAATSELWPKFADPAAALILRSGTEETHTVMGMGGTQNFQVTSVPKVVLELGGMPVSLQPAHILKTQQREAEKWFYGNLGIDLLEQAERVTIDFRKMTLVLLPGSTGNTNR